MPIETQTSFIPKKSLVEKETTRKKPISILTLITIVIFVLSAATAGSLFFYKKALAQKIQNMSVSLEKAKAAFDPSLIIELKRLSARIDNSNKILNGHVAPTALFEVLETSTLKSVRFKKMDYTMDDNGIKIYLSGEAKSYSSVALQSDVFGKSEYIKSPIFSNLNLDNKGNVTFDFNASIDNSLISYKRILSLNREQ